MRRSLGSSLGPCSIAEVLKLRRLTGYLATHGDKTTLDPAMFLRTPFPLLVGALPVELQMAEEQRLALSAGPLTDGGVPPLFFASSPSASMGMRSRERSGRSQSSGSTSASTAQLSFLTGPSARHGEPLQYTGLFLRGERGQNRESSSTKTFSSSKRFATRDWLQSAYENLIGPPPRWKRSALFRMGQSKDFNFLQPCSTIFLNASQTVSSCSGRNLIFI